MPGLRLLPLFPLSTVLFPGMALPLRIFEDRYKLMLRRCLEGDRTLGIVLIKAGWEVGEAADPHHVGTAARITRVERLDEGRMNLKVVGEQRFRIRSLVHGEPYLQADVEMLPEPAPSELDPLGTTVRHRFVEYVQGLRRLSGQPDSTFPMPEGILELSYAVAANLQISRIEQQALLEESPAQRLQHESTVLSRELTLIQRLGAVTSRRMRSPREFPMN